MKREVSDLKNALQNTNKQCKAARENLEWAMQSIDNLEQYTGKHNLEIHGLTEFEVDHVIMRSCGQARKPSKRKYSSKRDLYLSWNGQQQLR